MEKELHFQSKDLTIREFNIMEQKGRIQTNPEFQREFVYSIEKSSRLIESALMKIPLPTIYCSEEKSGKLLVVDGQQRIMSFLNFIRNKYKLKGMAVFSELEGKYFKDLDDKLQNVVEETYIRTIVIDEDSNDVKYEIFERLNQGAVTLKEQEIRNCVYRGYYNSMINQLAKNQNVAVMFKSENKRMSYQEKILRFFALIDFGSYKQSMKIHLNNYMKAHQYDDEKQIQQDKEIFSKTLSIVKEVLGTDAFAAVDYDNKKILNTFSATFYDSIMIAFSLFDRNKLIAKSDIIRKEINYKKLYDDEYHNACYASSGSRDRVLKRILTIIHLISSIVGDDPFKKDSRTFDTYLKPQLAENQKSLCAICQNEILYVNEGEIDHIVPYSHGGQTKFENAQLVHKICNRHKGKNIDIKKQEIGENNSLTYNLSEKPNLAFTKIKMYTFNGKTISIKSFRQFFISLMDEIKDIVPGKFNELADRDYTLTKTSKPYIRHSSFGMHVPYEIQNKVFIETCFSADRIVKLAKNILKEFNIDASSVVIYLKN